MLRPDIPASIRDVAMFAGINAGTLKKRLLKKHREDPSLLFRFARNGKWFTTLNACRRVFGAEFGRRVTSPEDLDAMAAALRAARRDLNASIARQRQFQQRSLAWFRDLEKRVGSARGDGANDNGAHVPNRPESISGEGQ